MTLRALLTFPALCTLALFLPACSRDDGSTGELGNGTFAYGCTSERDPLCSSEDSSASQPMPNSVAAGATFSVFFKAVSSAAQDGSASIVPVSTDLLVVENSAESAFRAVKPGYAGLLGMRGSTVVDVVHVHSVKPDRIRIDAGPDESGVTHPNTSAIAVGQGELFNLNATPVDEANEALAGSLSYQWTSNDSAIIEIVSSAATDTITVRGGSPGETALRVSVGGMDTEIAVTVTGTSAGSKSGDAKGAGGVP